MVWHHSLLLMNSFNKTEAAVFSCRLCFLGAFPFISLKLLSLYHFTLRIGHKSGIMLSILNKLLLQKELQTFVTNNVLFFFTKK